MLKANHIKWQRIINLPCIFILTCFAVSFWAGKHVPPSFTPEVTPLDVQYTPKGAPYFIKNNKEIIIKNPVTYLKANMMTLRTLMPQNIEDYHQKRITPVLPHPYAYKHIIKDDKRTKQFYSFKLKKHLNIWSLLPAFVAIVLCWLTKEPLSALICGIISGALLLGQYDITEQVLIPKLMTKNVAGILILYLWLLGALMGIWTKTGATKAFAEYMTKQFVKGPRSAKFVSWLLGILFFQGGTISTILVGTTVKPITDKHNVSHEELAYIVDSTASPIASQLAFNAWPGYIQSLIFVTGVSFLASETDRIAFFFRSVPFCFYAIFAVTFTFLLSIDKLPFTGKKLKMAIKRSRETGALDAVDAKPLALKDNYTNTTPSYYTPHILEFLIPLIVLITTAIGTFIMFGSPKVRWAFSLAFLSAMVIALLKGMTLTDLVDGIHDGFKSVVYGSVILLLAITIGMVSQETGGGAYVVELLGNRIPYWSLPVLLQLITIVIAFSTGTSWGTYAVAFPLTMPLAWAISQNYELAHPMFFMTICFAAVMDGSVFGDQCSPISDTTVLSSMFTGCDLMDHVKTQLPQASIAAFLAGICWTCCVLLFA